MGSRCSSSTCGSVPGTTIACCLVGYQPEVFVLARRGFAGGHMMFFGQFNAATRDQALAVQRLARQSVPLVLIAGSNRVGFREHFRDVARYADAHYQRMASIGAGADLHVIDVLRETSRPTSASAHEPTGWPCFR